MAPRTPSEEDLAIAMTTAPRRRPTLPQALASLRKAGFCEDVHVFAEPDTFVSLPRPNDVRAHVHENLTRRGCFGNWKHALEYLLSRTTAGWVLIVQDDAIWELGAADELLLAMRARQELRTGFLSPYVISKDVEKGSIDGWNECRAGWLLWGALALCMKRVAAEELLRHRRFRKHRGTQQVDAVVAASMLDLGRPSFVHVPSLVDHIGATSTLGHDDVASRLRGYRFGEKRR
jgi:hypothetical protein